MLFCLMLLTFFSVVVKIEKAKKKRRKEEKKKKPNERLKKCFEEVPGNKSWHLSVIRNELTMSTFCDGRGSTAVSESCAKQRSRMREVASQHQQISSLVNNSLRNIPFF